MSENDNNEIRSAAELIINNTRTTMSYRSLTGGSLPPGYDISRTHSINLITEEFLGGYMQDGRMSVVRRFFCLFVTFDLFFVSLLWLICIMINGDNIFQAFQKQIVHYTIGKSLFDVVAAAICRFLILIFFYALLYINHWIIIALSTSGSCLFLISKVFCYDWVDSHQQVFEVILIITSFVLAWGEAWFLDCRVIPQERHARSYFSAVTSSDRSPLMAPLLASQNDGNVPECIFYSPLETLHNSDDEEDQQDEEYNQMGLNCVRKAYELFESADWKVEKVTPKGDTIRSTQREKLGKVYRLTGRIKYPAKALLEELFYKIEEVPKWNPTILESKIVRKINSYTDITYQATVGGGRGMVKSRDFVNLRCWRLIRGGRICDENEGKSESGVGGAGGGGGGFGRYTDDDEENWSSDNAARGSVSTISDADSVTPQPSSVESGRMKFLPSGSVVGFEEDHTNAAFQTLSKSLGAKDFSTTLHVVELNEPPPLDEEFIDIHDNFDEEAGHPSQSQTAAKTAHTDKVWVSAAISVDYTKIPPTAKYTRGENIVAGFAMYEIAGKPDACIFDWILCLDLKGYIPRYVLDSAYTTFMVDYMKYLRKYVSELREKRKRAKD